MTENPFDMSDMPVVSITKGRTTKTPFFNDQTTEIKEQGKGIVIKHAKPLIDSDKIQVIFGNIPSKSNCYKIITFKSKDPNKSHASLAKTKALSQYEKDFYIQCNKYRNAAIDDYFTLEVDVYYPSQRSDLDNCLKVLLDCLQKVNAIKNDNKCVRIVANKFLDAKNPRVEFVIKKAM